MEERDNVRRASYIVCMITVLPICFLITALLTVLTFIRGAYWLNFSIPTYSVSVDVWEVPIIGLMYWFACGAIACVTKILIEQCTDMTRKYELSMRPQLT